jgi:hypothetical protein
MVIFPQQNCHFGDLEAPFWVPWVTILVIQGSTGTPNRHIGVQVSIFIDFRVILGVSWNPFWGTFLWFVCDLGCQSGTGPCFWWSRDGNDANAVAVCAINIVKNIVYSTYQPFAAVSQLPAALRLPEQKHAPGFLEHVYCKFSELSWIWGPHVWIWGPHFQQDAHRNYLQTNVLYCS